MGTRDEIVSAVRRVLLDEGCQFAVIYGSLAEGNFDENSDVDILASFDRRMSYMGENSILRINQRIEDEVGREIDLSTFESADDVFLARAMRDPIVVIGEDKEEYYRENYVGEVMSKEEAMNNIEDTVEKISIK